ncbi:MAG: hypothetical protein KatS3mg102_1161 [Planctomycetota bacterium]|nr:MAG: hypothetical protein KatS3mg102_1161 [Planctomycetota bacterium]
MASWERRSAVRATAAGAPAARPRRRRRLVLLLGLGAAAVAAGAGCVMFDMPGRSYRGPLPALSAAQAELAARLQADVDALAGQIGERHLLAPQRYAAAADWVERRLAEASGRAVRRLPYRYRDVQFTNLEVQWRGTEQPERIVVVGAHYDSMWDCPGADDNASGVAALLALASALRAAAPARTLRLVAFANEEPPAFQTEAMGSLAYARAARARGERVVAMLSLESLGYYDERPGSQRYPGPLKLLYPDRGDFIAFVGNLGSCALLRRVVRTFRAHARFPSEGAALPGWVPGVGWSDHWSFWQAGYPAIMVTDTALYRNPWYHDEGDTPERLDYERMARVVEGLVAVVRELVGLPPAPR